MKFHSIEQTVSIIVIMARVAVTVAGLVTVIFSRRMVSKGDGYEMVNESRQFLGSWGWELRCSEWGKMGKQATKALARRYIGDIWKILQKRKNEGE